MMRDDGCVCRLLSPRIGSNMAEDFIILGSIIDWLTCSGHHVLPRDTVPRPRASCAFRTIFTAFQSLVLCRLEQQPAVRQEQKNDRKFRAVRVILEGRTERRVRAPGLQAPNAAVCRPGALTRRSGRKVSGSAAKSP